MARDGTATGDLEALHVDETEYDPRTAPFRIDTDVDGTINGQEIAVNGVGTIRQPGVYRASLGFSTVPDGFHPSVFAAQVVSVSCSRLAFTRNTPNMEERGVETYESERTVRGDGIDMTVSGEAYYHDDSLEMDLTVSGECDLPDDAVGTTAYFVRWTPVEDGVVGTGELSIAREGNERLPTKLDSTYHGFEPDPLPVPFEEPQYRIVTEAGRLDGQTYETEIHSLLDRGTVFEEIDRLEPAHE